MKQHHIDYLLSVVAEANTSTNTQTHLDKDPKHQQDFADWLAENLNKNDPADTKIHPQSRKKLMGLAGAADAPNPAGGRPSQPVIKDKGEKKKPMSKDLKEFVDGPKGAKPTSKKDAPAEKPKDDGEWQIVEDDNGSTELKITAAGKLFSYEFIYETDDDDDPGYRKIKAESREAAIEELKRQTKGQKIKVSAIQSRPVRVEAMGVRSDGLITKKVNVGIYDVEYKGRKFEVMQGQPYGGGRPQWQLKEHTDKWGDDGYIDHYVNKADALEAIKIIVDRDSQTTAAAHKHSDIEHTVRDIFRASGMALGPHAAVELKPSKVSGKLVHIFSDITSVSHKDMLSIRARLTHKFHAKGFAVKSIIRKGRPAMQFSFMMRDIKKTADGKPKLVKKPQPKKKSKIGNRQLNLATAAFTRLEAAAKLKF